MSSYADGNDLIARFDADIVGDLASDNRVNLLRDDIPTHANVLSALADAAGEVEANILIGGRYTVAQLESLDTNSTALLKRIICTIAMSNLFDRRPGILTEMAEKIRKRTDAYVDKMKSGNLLFTVSGDTGHVEASKPELHGPTSTEIETRNFLASRMSGRFMPEVWTRNPVDRG